MQRKLLLPFAAAATLLATLTACAGGEDAETEQDAAGTSAEQQTGGEQEDAPGADSEAPEEDSADAGQDSGAATADDVALTVDGEAVDLGETVVGCTDTGAGFSVAVSSSTADEIAGGTVAAIFASADDPTVTALSLIDNDGNVLAYAEGSYEGGVEATIDGNTYAVTGEAMSTAGETSTFELTVTCP